MIAHTRIAVDLIKFKSKILLTSKFKAGIMLNFLPKIRDSVCL